MVRKAIFILLFFISNYFSYSQCGLDWLQVNGSKSGLRLGDLDISGDQLTVEATINRTAAYSGGLLYAGDIVSKHRDPNDANYLLRPNDAEITTTNGYFRTPDICEIELNKTYHIAMVYNGKTLKFYRNGFLMSQVAATGNLYLNDWITTIGTTADLSTIYPTDFIGYINEVRIWRVARTQTQLRAYMQSLLPNPALQIGLLAYYQLYDPRNQVDNGQWNGTKLNNANWARDNSTCSSFIADSCGIKITTSVTVTPSFTAPDTVCVGTPVKIKNTSSGASSYYWNFALADINSTPESINLGNPGNTLSQPVFTDFTADNGNYYVFVVNHYPGSLVRLDYGKSMLNTPTATNLGNFGGIIPSGYGSEGIQLVNNEGKWYAIIIAGSPSNGTDPRLLKIDFGTSLSNLSPTATSWGNVGDIYQPIDLHIFNENSNWYGFTVDAINNKIVRFNFTNSFNNVPTADNLGNIGNLNYPTGIYAINSNNEWHVFVANAGSNTLTRLDFGNSLLNTPTGINLGNPNSTLNSPRDFYIIPFCGELIGFLVNGTTSDLVKLNFNNDIKSSPSATSLGNTGSLNFPHSISKLFRVGSDLYSFITNVNNNTITRLKFAGSTNASIPNSTVQNPPDIIYNSPGIYNINLTVDEGLPTQNAFCKPIVVVAPLAKQSLIDTTACDGDSLTLKAPETFPDFQWSTGSLNSSIVATKPGNFWVQTKYYGCTARDSFLVKQSISPVVDLGKDTGLCTNQYLVLNAGNNGSSYLWNDGNTKQTDTIFNSGSYNVTVINSNKCVAKDSITITQLPSPVITGLFDTTICIGDSFQIQASSPGNNTYKWFPATALSNTSIINPVASPDVATKYHLTVTNSSKCITADSITIAVASKPVVTISSDTSVCYNSQIQLNAVVSNADKYYWSPAQGLTDTASLTPAAIISGNINYIFTSFNNACRVSDNVAISVLPSPDISVIPVNITICANNTIQLTASGGLQYHWFPSTGLSNTEIANPVANPVTSTVYYVTVTGSNTCTKQDSVIINVKSLSPFTFSANASTVCLGDTVFLLANGGNQYNWSLNPGINNPNPYSAVAVPTSTTTYNVIISDTFCKITDTLSATVNVTAALQLHLSKSNDVDCNTSQAQLIATGADSYSWQPAETVSNSFVNNPFVTPSQTTTYYVMGKSNNSGCTGYDSVVVIVKNTGDNTGKQMPGAFTPNNDGINDCFGFKKWGYVNDAELTIYNRWGQMLFRATNNGQCWDGTYNGKPQPSGTYVYQIKAKTLCGNVYRKGTVVLIR